MLSTPRARNSTPSSRAAARALGAALALACGVLAAAHAEPPARAAKPRVPQPEDVLPESELDDPIGLDRESRGLARAAAVPAAKQPDAAALQAERARYGPQPPPLDVRAGEVLTAAPSTRELSHRVQVELDPGLAVVSVEMSFESRAQKPSELRYRLAVPAGSRLAALEVCNARGCRAGLPEAPGAAVAYDAALLARGPDDPLPVARARSTRDARGEAIVVQAAPVQNGQTLALHVRYVSPAPLHGGVVRLSLPARGMDPQVAPSEVTLAAPRLLDPRIGGAPAGAAGASYDAWLELPLQARARSGEPAHASAWQLGCGKQRCGWAVLWAGPRPPQPVDLVLALDVSPSTEGPARGRLLSTVAALLAAAPEGSRVRALAFGARAQPLIERAMEPAQVALAPFGRAIEHAELGSATRFEAVWGLARGWLKTHVRGLKPLLVIVGDGGLTAGEARPFRAARAAGVEVCAVNAADRGSSAELRAGVLATGGLVVDAGGEAEAAARGRDEGPLGERLAALFAPTVAARVRLSANGHTSELGPLRAGELLGWQGAGGSLLLRYGSASVRGQLPPQAWRALAPALAASAADSAGLSGVSDARVAVDARDLALAGAHDWPAQPAKGCDRRGPARRPSGLSSDAAPLALAEERACKPPPKAVARSGGGAEIGAGMPADPLLEMLRQRIMPVARGCFRRDRAGRPDYATRAVFVFTLADKEVVDARVEGKIASSLRSCLLAAVDTLEVPRFAGVVKVRYPLITESVPLPEQIELRSGTARNLDRLFGTPDAK